MTLGTAMHTTRSIARRVQPVCALAGVLCVAATRLALADDVARACGPKFIHLQSIESAEKLLVACEKSDTILKLDAQTGDIEAEVSVGESPFAMTPAPDGRRLYISCRRGQEVLELDAGTLQVLRHFALRGDPAGLAVSANGRRLYVGLHTLDQVAVLDLQSGEVIRRLAAGNGPEMLRLAPRQGKVYVTNLLSNPVPPNQPPQNEITVIDDASARVCERIILDNANVGRCIEFASGPSLAIAAISRPKNLVPMVQVARGWVVTNGFAVFDPDSSEPPAQLLVDLPNRAFSDPYGVAITPDDSKFYLSCAGVDTVIAVDLAKVRHVVAESAEGRIPRPADNLGLSRRYVTARIPVGVNPEALAISADGRRLYVANRLDDTISVIDTELNQVDRTLRLGAPPAPDRLARGELFFHSAGRTFQEQFSCNSCHPNRSFDGLRYDMEPDGLGQDILDNRNLRAVAGTGPFKWVGSNPDITTQCGTRTAKWIVRTGWLSSAEVVDLATYIRALPAVVNPHRSRNGELTAAQRRGKELFERTTTNDGAPIAERDRCDYCHAGPKFTDGRKFDVGTQGPHDGAVKFDTAHLINVFESAPYLHDGRAATLEEIWTVHNPEDKHGISNDWTKQQLNDLVEYLKSL